MKPTVHYIKEDKNLVFLGGVAYVYCLDHPRLGRDFIRTSTVLAYDEATGEFETKNTLYKPYKE